MKPYLKYLIEFVVIVFGITASFMVDEWREERQNREEVRKALHLMLNNLKSDSLLHSDLLQLASNQKDELHYLLLNEGVVKDSLLIDVFFALWTVSGQAGMSSSGLENLYSIKGVEFTNDGLQEHLDKYYNASTLNHELTDWHLTNQRIDDFKWRKLNRMNELVLIVKDTLMTFDEKLNMVIRNTELNLDLRQYYTNTALLNLASDKYLMVRNVEYYLIQQLRKNQELKFAILKELKN